MQVAEPLSRSPKAIAATTRSISAGQYEDRIAAGQLHDGGGEMCRQLMKNGRARCRGAGKKNLVHAGRDSIGSRLGTFV